MAHNFEKEFEGKTEMKPIPVLSMMLYKRLHDIPFSDKQNELEAVLLEMHAAFKKGMPVKFIVKDYNAWSFLPGDCGPSLEDEGKPKWRRALSVFFVENGIKYIDTVERMEMEQSLKELEDE